MYVEVELLVLLPILCSAALDATGSDVGLKAANLEREDEGDETSQNEVEPAVRSENGFENLYGRGANDGVGVALDFIPESRKKSLQYERRGSHDYKHENPPLTNEGHFTHASFAYPEGSGLKSRSDFEGFGVLCRRRGILGRGGFFLGSGGGEDQDIGVRGRFNFPGRGGLDLGGYGGINVGDQRRRGVNFGGYGRLDFGGYGIHGEVAV